MIGRHDMLGERRMQGRSLFVIAACAASAVVVATTAIGCRTSILDDNRGCDPCDAFEDLAGSSGFDADPRDLAATVDQTRQPDSGVPDLARVPSDGGDMNAAPDLRHSFDADAGATDAGCEREHIIDSNLELVNLPVECSGQGKYYQSCAGNAWGVQWEDRLLGKVLSVVVEIQPGINCDDAMALPTALNGVPTGVDVLLRPVDCGCVPMKPAPPVTIRLEGAQLQGYRSRQVNQFTVRRGRTCAGVAPNAGLGGWARVTVRTTGENRVCAAPPPPWPSPCTTGVDPHTLARWVVCRADDNRAWVSGFGGIYHAELVCGLLGYKSLGPHGGTCGAVCGHCEQGTSCIAPGKAHFDRQGDDGSDMFGRRLRGTVHWECLR